METTKYDDVEIKKTKAGWMVTWYEWVEGKGWDCGLNREQGPFETRADASEYAAQLQ